MITPRWGYLPISKLSSNCLETTKCCDNAKRQFKSIWSKLYMSNDWRACECGKWEWQDPSPKNVLVKQHQPWHESCVHIELRDNDSPQTFFHLVFKHISRNHKLNKYEVTMPWVAWPCMTMFHTSSLSFFFYCLLLNRRLLECTFLLQYIDTPKHRKGAHACSVWLSTLALHLFLQDLQHHHCSWLELHSHHNSIFKTVGMLASRTSCEGCHTFSSHSLGIGLFLDPSPILVQLLMKNVGCLFRNQHTQLPSRMPLMNGVSLSWVIMVTFKQS